MAQATILVKDETSSGKIISEINIPLKSDVAGRRRQDHRQNDYVSNQSQVT